MHPTPIVLFYGDAAYHAILMKKGRDCVSYITRGWTRLARAYRFQVGEVFVISVHIVHGVLLLQVLQLPLRVIEMALLIILRLQWNS